MNAETMHRSGLMPNKTLMNAEGVNQRGYQRVSASILIIYGIILLLFSTQARAEDKQWTGTYDASSWGNDANWFSSGVPTVSDDATITVQDASVLISDASKAFNAKSITVAGRADSTLTAADFVYGLISPSAATDNALYIRKGGNVILQGTGTITLKGRFKNSEETLPDEPAFMFGAE